MWGLANLARLLGWFAALLYSECLAALARPRALPESLPAWLVEGARRPRAREIPDRARARPDPPPPPPSHPGDDDDGARVSAIVTGARTGIGRELVSLLAARGAHVHVVCRTLAEARETCARVAATRPGASLRPHGADLSDPRDVDALARSLRARPAHARAPDPDPDPDPAHAPPRLVAHCAGVMRARCQRTPRGDDVDAAVNAFAPAALTAALLDDPDGDLRRAVFVGSFTHRATFPGDARRWYSTASSSSSSTRATTTAGVFEDGAPSQCPAASYACSKAAVTAHARRLARDRTRDPRFTVAIADPGLVDTAINRHWPSTLRAFYVAFARVAGLMASPRDGARAVLHACFLHPDEARAVEGGYVYGVRGAAVSPARWIEARTPTARRLEDAVRRAWKDDDD